MKKNYIVVTQTPLRISFFGGGTDMKNFYNKHNGAVLSVAINKYVYVIVKKHNVLFQENIRLNVANLINKCCEVVIQLKDIPHF